MPTTNKVLLIKQLIEEARNNLETATSLLNDLSGITNPTGTGKKPVAPVDANGGIQRTDQGAVIIEGVFDGQNMVGPDGKMYSVPANYASKSKLVEGDLLKLTISPNGSFIYKQIGPVERDRLMGVLVRDEQSEEFRVLSQGRYYKVLLASVTYFKGSVGDEVVILVPKSTVSTWAAIENFIKAGESIPSSLALDTTPVRPAELTDSVPVKRTVRKAATRVSDKEKVTTQTSVNVEKIEI